MNACPVQQPGRLAQGEAQLIGPQLAQLAGGAESRNSRQGVPAGQDEHEACGTVADQEIQTVHGLRTDQLMCVIEDDPNGALQLSLAPR